MDLLSAIALQVFRHAEEDEHAIYYDASHEISFSRDSDTDDAHPGDRLNRVGTRFGDGSILSRRHASHGRKDRKDRTAWGSYTENCPPILPPNACITGFEEETLFIAEPVRKRTHKKGKKHESFATDDEEASDDDDDADEEEIGGERTGLASTDMRNYDSESDRTVAARIAGARDSRRVAPTPSLSRLPTFSSLSSTLFGSTTRPSARTLAAPESSATRTRNVTRIRRRNMAAAKTYWWISLWFLLSAPVIFWDAGFCFMRPRSFAGGDLHWIWKPYELYQEVDYIYGVEAYKRGDGFTNAQSFMNIVETFLNLYYVYAQHVLGTPSAPLVGFAAVVMTLSKTVLYWLQEYYCGGCAVGHNDLKTLILFWIIPNGIWLIFPSLIMRQLGRDITSGLTTASKITQSKKGK